MHTFILDSNNYPWDENGYKPKVVFELDTNDTGFTMHITAYEKNPKITTLEHQNYVHIDSCVEWFANFMPEKNNAFFNFEVNAKGIMYVNYQERGVFKIPPTVEEINSFGIIPVINENTWEISYTIPFSFIKKYIPEFEYKKGMTIKSNFFKCGDETEFPHFGIYNPTGEAEPNFHRPHAFIEVIV